jgi:outer membrane protein assembly factor BamB
VLVATADGDGSARVHAFDLGGTLRWSAPIRPFLRQILPPATLTDELLITSSVAPDGLQALRLDDGTVAWTAAIELSLTTPAARAGRRLFVSDAKELIALDLDTGEYEISAVSCDNLTVADGVLVCGKGAATVAYPVR